MSHSPLPWEMLEHKSGDTLDQFWIVTQGPPQPMVCRINVIDALKEPIEHAEGNAKLIVTAVNHHDELVAALDSCLTQIEQMAGMFPDDDGAIKNAADSAREVLASVRGQQPEKATPPAAAEPARVWIEVIGGCAYYESEGNVIVELTDYDNDEDEEEAEIEG